MHSGLFGLNPTSKSMCKGFSEVEGASGRRRLHWCCRFEAGSRPPQPPAAVIMLYSILGHEVSNITLLIEIDYVIERKNKFLDHFLGQKLNMHLVFVFVFNSCINET